LELELTLGALTTLAEADVVALGIAGSAPLAAGCVIGFGASVADDPPDAVTEDAGAGMGVDELGGAASVGAVGVVSGCSQFLSSGCNLSRCA
jgi:hypothetical protein